VPGAKVSVRAGHGVGKTSAVAAAIWWFLECFDYPKIPCTAPSASQLRDVLWAELAKLERKSDDLSRKNDLPKALWLSSLFNITQDRIADVGRPDEWFAVARTARKENPDALQGFHASDLTISDDGASVSEVGDDGGQIMFVIEEASGVADQIFEVAEGALSSHAARLLMVGNPTRNKGYFALSHKKDRGSYTALHFRCADSPLVGPNYRNGLVKKWGEGSNIVRVRADGEFPKQDDDVLISVEATEAALLRPRTEGRGARRLGVDVARFGDDRTVFLLRQGSLIERVKVFSKQDTMETVGYAVKYRLEWAADQIDVDATGMGAGVVDRLKELKEPVNEVTVAEVAPERTKTDSDGQAWKLRDHLWLEMARYFRDEEPCFGTEALWASEDLAGELCSVKYRLDSNGRIVVESKDDMKKRLGRSPDIADALGLTFSEMRGPIVFHAGFADQFNALTRGRRR
jgi:phage terminase large subunit